MKHSADVEMHTATVLSCEFVVWLSKFVKTCYQRLIDGGCAKSDCMNILFSCVLERTLNNCKQSTPIFKI